MGRQTMVGRIGIWGLLAAGLAGCSSPASWRFGPTPQDHELLFSDDPAVVARVQVAALGLGEEAGWEMHFRLRIENAGAEAVQLDPGELQLVDGLLNAFGPAVVRAHPPSGDQEVAKGTVRIFDVAFPLPAGREPDDLDLENMSLRWGIKTHRGLLVASASFGRVRYYYHYHDPYCGHWY